MPRESDRDNDRIVIEQLVQHALDLPATQRKAFLDARCRELPSELRSEVFRRVDRGHQANVPHTFTDPSGPADAGDSKRCSGEQLPSETPRDHDDPDQPFQQMTDLRLPRTIGRYRAVSIIGHGGFGFVLLARDDSLDRHVAIKVPRPDRVGQSWDVDHSLAEARVVAQLDHPHILPVYDVGRDDFFGFFIVSKYVKGESLHQQMRQRRFDCLTACRLVAKVASGLHCAHTRGIVHRDVKPANVLLDAQGEPHIADFGIALREDNLGQEPRYTGSPRYMSPEQASGEGHRVDGRSDIFGLGVVLYELLVGRRPFVGDTRAELQAQIIAAEPKPPRQINDELPREVERICLKALAKRVSDRYTTALDLADELNDACEVMVLRATNPLDATALAARMWDNATDTPSNGTTGRRLQTWDSSYREDRPRIIPKGMRSYDSGDKDFFFELIPGPRDRFGVPDSIRMWKSKIEQLDPAQTIPVGLIYGPSGCGKSSLVKAGLLPSLSSVVTPIYLEATPHDTVRRITRALQRRFPQMPRHRKLNETMRALRCGRWIPPGEKVLIVLDQFEQWLHGHRPTKRSRLIKALRQCDGERLQCLVMVRDDFWMAATRFMRELEVPLIENHNSAAVDLLPMQHARKVLTAFGRAYAALPQDESAISDDQRAFVSQAVDAIAVEDQVICVRLALLAEMMKNRDWTPQTLRDVGGTLGLGETYLEETFNRAAALPEHRYHQDGAREILRALLPEVGTNIRGHMRSYSELLQASGYHHRRRHDFNRLIDVMDHQLRLITPTDPDGVLDALPEKWRHDVQQFAQPDPTKTPPADDSHTDQAATDSSSSDSNIDDSSRSIRAVEQQYFQLTHDFLVPSVRNWLTRRRRETRRGRAELVLEERSSEWNARSVKRNLPTGWEWLRIRLFTRSRQWNARQRRMMQRADLIHLFRLGTAALLVAALAASVGRLITANRRSRAETLVQSVLTAPSDAVPYAIERLTPLRRYAITPLTAQLERDDLPSMQRLHALAALAEMQSVDPGDVIQLIPKLPGPESGNVIQALNRRRSDSIQMLGVLIQAMDQRADWPLKARYATTSLYLGDPTGVEDMLAIGDRSDYTQRSVWIDSFQDWSGRIEKLPQLIQQLESPGVRSGIALAIGSVGIAHYERDVLRPWQDILEDWYTNDPDSATHSASSWALQQLDVALPHVATASTPNKGRQWCHTQTGLRLIKIPKPPDTFRSTSGRVPSQSYLIADREVTREQFEAFVADQSYPGPRPTDWPGPNVDISPTKNHPVQMVNWFDAIKFCNWLSWREGLRPAYTKVNENEANSEMLERWQLVEPADGFRLPTIAQWEYACFAGGDTIFSFGSDDAFLRQYATFRSISASPAASRFCNVFGLFDVEGNVWEWCQNRSERPHGRVHKGGAWNTSARQCAPRKHLQSHQMGRVPYLGFRPVAIIQDAKASP